MTSQRCERNPRFEVRNLVATADLGYSIDLHELSSSSFFGSMSTYDPSAFNAVIVRHPDIRPRTILVFRTGKLVITGAKSERGVDEALDLIEPELIRFESKKSENGS